MKSKRMMTLAVAGVGLVGCTSGTTDVHRSDLGGVVVIEGNPTCADAASVLGIDLGDFSYKIDPPQGGTYDLDGHNTVTMVTPDGIYLDWSATIGIDAVIVKGGPMANVYLYDPESTGATALSPPINANNGIPYAISHVDFCFDYEVAVAKTAHTSFTRTYAWSLDKTAALGAVTLAQGEIYAMAYQVVVTRTGFVDSDWAAGGTVTITNPSPYAATIDDVSDLLDGSTPVALDCGVTFPYELAPFASLECTYALAFADASAHVNHVDVCTSGIVGPGSASAAIDFGAATITERDACVDVTDDHAGALGTACDDATFEYVLELGPYGTCDTTDTFVNVASYAGCDSGLGGSDSATVAITVPACDVGCTLTQGYWKTHSSYGPAPKADATWAAVGGPDASFFLSGKSYHDVLWTQPQGNAYYVLAHAYIAAELNLAGGASGGALGSAFGDAHTIFTQVTPAYVASLRKNSTLIVRMLALASTLDAYDNGLIGPGHCTE